MQVIGVAEEQNKKSTAPKRLISCQLTVAPVIKGKESFEMENNNFSSSIIVMIAKLVIALMTKFWTACAAGLLILLLCFWLYGSLMALLLMVVAILGALYNAQDMLLYHPDQPQNSRIYVESPAILRLPYDNIFINTSDGERIHMVLIKQPTEIVSKVFTVIFFHGNAGNIGHRLLNAYTLYNFCKCNVLLVEYRGYGKSTGTPSEKGFYLDAEAAVAYAMKHSEIDEKKLIVFGRSLGGAVAVYIASHPFFSTKLAGLIVENTFLTLPEIGRSIFNFRPVTLLPEWCHKNKYRSRDRIGHVICPVLFLSGLADSLIPPRMMRQLHDMCSSEIKHLQCFDGGTHNETWQSTGYYEAVNKFLMEISINRPHLQHSNQEKKRKAYSHIPDAFAV